MLATIATVLGIIGSLYSLSGHLTEMSASEQARYNELCADKFKSFDVNTKMWTDYQGLHHHCPKI